MFGEANDWSDLCVGVFKAEKRQKDNSPLGWELSAFEKRENKKLQFRKTFEND